MFKRLVRRARRRPLSPPAAVVALALLAIPTIAATSASGEPGAGHDLFDTVDTVLVAQQLREGAAAATHPVVPPKLHPVKPLYALPAPKPVVAAPVAAPAPAPAPAPRPARAPSAPTGGVWDRLAACESGGNWAAATGNGFYGGLQFTVSSWHAVGGSGMPNHADRGTQIAMGQRLQAAQGWSAWPACARRLGLR